MSYLCDFHTKTYKNIQNAHKKIPQNRNYKANFFILSPKSLKMVGFDEIDQITWSKIGNFVFSTSRSRDMSSTFLNWFSAELPRYEK